MVSEKEQMIEGIVQEIDGSPYEMNFLPIAIDEEAETDFCILISKPHEDPEGTQQSIYYLAFIQQPPQNATEFTRKTWSELTTETSIDFRKMMFAAAGVDVRHDEAVMSIRGHTELKRMIGLCDDIASSMRIGGYQPLDAGDLFKAYYSPSTIGQASSALNSSQRPC